MGRVSGYHTEERTQMQIQINTDGNIEGNEELAAKIRGVVESGLGRFAQQVTYVQVHLRDENGSKSGQEDKRCMLEARLAGRQPTAVTHHASTVDDAVDGAIGKLHRAIESTLGRLADQR